MSQRQKAKPPRLDLFLSGSPPPRRHTRARAHVRVLRARVCVHTRTHTYVRTRSAFVLSPAITVLEKYACRSISMCVCVRACASRIGGTPATRGRGDSRRGRKTDAAYSARPKKSAKVAIANGAACAGNGACACALSYVPEGTRESCPRIKHKTRVARGAATPDVAWPHRVTRGLSLSLDVAR